MTAFRKGACCLEICIQCPQLVMRSRAPIYLLQILANSKVAVAAVPALCLPQHEDAQQEPYFVLGTLLLILKPMSEASVMASDLLAALQAKRPPRK